MRTRSVLIAFGVLAAALVAGLHFFQSHATTSPMPAPAVRQDSGASSSKAAEIDTSARRASAEGGRVNAAHVELPSGSTGVEVAHVPGTMLMFQVVDAVDAKPVTELEVRIASGNERALTDQNGRKHTTFPDGRVSFPNAFPEAGDESPDLTIEARGFKTLRVPHLTPVAGQDLDLGVLRLERAPRVHVLVLDDATGEPMSGAYVSLELFDAVKRTSAPGRPAMPLGPPPPHQSARTDDAGRALVNSLPGRRATLSVRQSTYAEFQSAPIDLPVAGDHEATVRMHIEGIVTVQVLDALGSPVQGVPLRHTDPRGNVRVITSFDFATDAEGKREYQRLDVGRHRFEVADDTLVSDVGTKSAAEVDVQPSSTQSVTLTLPARARITGRITQGGEPLSEATLTFLRDETSVLQARTDAHGDYSVRSIAIGAYRVIVMHPDRALPHETKARILDAHNQFDVDLPVTRVEGRLVDVSGGTLRRTSVMVKLVGGTDSLGAARKSQLRGMPVQVDAEGHFVLRGVTPDTEFYVVTLGGAYQPVRSEVLRLASGEVRTGLELRLTPGAELAVRLVRGDGQSASECTVRIFEEAAPEGSEASFTMTTGGGVTRYGGLRPGKWRVHVEPCGASAGGTVLPVPDRLVDVRVGEPNSVTIAVP